MSNVLHWGSGKKTLLIPSLGEVYTLVGLPEPKQIEQLPNGELVMLEKTETLTFADEVRKAKNIIRKSAKVTNTKE